MPRYPVLAACHINGRDYAPGDTTADLDVKRAHWLARQRYLQIDGVTPPKAAAPLRSVPPPPRRCCGG